MTDLIASKATHGSLPADLIPQEVRRSDAWRSLGLAARKLVDFLLLQFDVAAGNENGRLAASIMELRFFGIGPSNVQRGMRQAEAVGLLKRNVPDRGKPATFTLTWLPTYDGQPATNAWRQYRNPRLRAVG